MGKKVAITKEEVTRSEWNVILNHSWPQEKYRKMLLAIRLMKNEPTPQEYIEGIAGEFGGNERDCINNIFHRANMPYHLWRSTAGYRKPHFQIVRRSFA